MNLKSWASNTLSQNPKMLSSGPIAESGSNKKKTPDFNIKTVGERNFVSHVM